MVSRLRTPPAIGWTTSVSGWTLHDGLLPTLIIDGVPIIALAAAEETRARLVHAVDCLHVRGWGSVRDRNGVALERELSLGNRRPGCGRLLGHGFAHR